MAKSDMKRVRAAEIELTEKVVKISRVTKVNKGGRTFSFSTLVVVGDGNGVVGYGLGKAREVSESIQKAVDDAKKNLVKVPIINSTVPHVQKGKFGGAKIIIKPASAGTGLIAGGAMRAVLDAAGVHNIVAKSLGSSNPSNVVKATMDALLQLRPAHEVAAIRGISIDKVFKG